MNKNHYRECGDDVDRHINPFIAVDYSLYVVRLYLYQLSKLSLLGIHFTRPILGNIALDSPVIEHRTYVHVLRMPIGETLRIANRLSIPIERGYYEP